MVELSLQARLLRRLIGLLNADRAARTPRGLNPQPEPGDRSGFCSLIDPPSKHFSP